MHGRFASVVLGVLSSRYCSSFLRRVRLLMFTFWLPSYLDNESRPARLCCCIWSRAAQHVHGNVCIAGVYTKNNFLGAADMILFVESYSNCRRYDTRDCQHFHWCLWTNISLIRVEADIIECLCCWTKVPFDLSRRRFHLFCINVLDTCRVKGFRKCFLCTFDGLICLSELGYQYKWTTSKGACMQDQLWASKGVVTARAFSRTAGDCS